jgi:predicted nucleic acid-binding Zn ribbon protein
MTSSELERSWLEVEKALPDYVRKAIDSYSKNFHLTHWQFICGILLFSWQSSSFSTPVIEPGWTSDNPVIQDESTCPICQKTFTPKIRGQRFCSHECGQIFNDQEDARLKGGIVKKEVNNDSVSAALGSIGGDSKPIPTGTIIHSDGEPAQQSYRDIPNFSKGKSVIKTSTILKGTTAPAAGAGVGRTSNSTI